MLRIEIRFLAGRYHATPWGRHVNEGDIEWPPSPWRLCRALLATGFIREGWSRVPDQAAALIETLAAVPPIFHLPPATAAHTRHYMPVYKDNPDKVLDTFAYPGRDAPLYIEWDADLPRERIDLVDHLLEAMPYLGRAESWIQARRVEDIPGTGLIRCAPAAHPPGPDHERLDLLAPMLPADYAPWRAQTLENMLARRLADKQQAQAAKGKKPAGTLPAKERDALARALPPTLIDALCASTAELQKAGWSQPPGSRWLHYWRAADALRAPPRTAARAAHADRAGTAPDTALLAVSSDTRRNEVRPHMHLALWQGERLHQALVNLSDQTGDGTCAPCLTGRDPDGAPMRGHRHVTILALDLDGDDHIDHFALHAPMTFDRNAVAALRRIQRTWGQKLPDLFLSLAALGHKPDLAGQVPALAAARAWVSRTPFVPPRHLKPRGNSSLAGQVHAELAARGLPAPARVQLRLGKGAHTELLDEADFWPLWHARPAVTLRDGAPADRLRNDHARRAAAGADPGPTRTVARILGPWRHFRRGRRTPDRRPPMDVALGLRLLFDQPVQGPICLGYGSHYGLGMFVPEEAS